MPISIRRRIANQILDDCCCIASFIGRITRRIGFNIEGWRCPRPVMGYPARGGDAKSGIDGRVDGMPGGQDRKFRGHGGHLFFCTFKSKSGATGKPLIFNRLW